MQAERMRGGWLGVDPPVVVAAYDPDVRDDEMAARPCAPGDDLMRIQPPSASDLGYELLGLAAAAVAVPRRIYRSSALRQLRERALRPRRDRGAPAAERGSPADHAAHSQRP